MWLQAKKALLLQKHPTASYQQNAVSINRMPSRLQEPTKHFYFTKQLTIATVTCAVWHHNFMLLSGVKFWTQNQILFSSSSAIMHLRTCWLIDVISIRNVKCWWSCERIVLIEIKPFDIKIANHLWKYFAVSSQSGLVWSPILDMDAKSIFFPNNSQTWRSFIWEPADGCDGRISMISRKHRADWNNTFRHKNRIQW